MGIRSYIDGIFSVFDRATPRISVVRMETSKARARRDATHAFSTAVFTTPTRMASRLTNRFVASPRMGSKEIVS